MAECFADSFSSVYVSDLPINSFSRQIFHSTIEDLVISVERVECVLMSLDANSSMGDDGMHPRLLKALAHDLSYPLTLLYNNSLRSGELPREWLRSMVVPIYKKSFRFDPLNYRPISLTSVICKSLERVVVEHINLYLNSNALLSDEQFGFRAGYSTVD